jgi:hypothetical protein
MTEARSHGECAALAASCPDHCDRGILYADPEVDDRGCPYRLESYCHCPAGTLRQAQDEPSR